MLVYGDSNDNKKTSDDYSAIDAALIWEDSGKNSDCTNGYTEEELKDALDSYYSS